MHPEYTFVHSFSGMSSPVARSTLQLVDSGWPSYNHGHRGRPVPAIQDRVSLDQC